MRKKKEKMFLVTLKPGVVCDLCKLPIMEPGGCQGHELRGARPPDPYDDSVDAVIIKEEGHDKQGQMIGPVWVRRNREMAQITRNGRPEWLTYKQAERVAAEKGLPLLVV